jgi:hypothetical protein
LSNPLDKQLIKVFVVFLCFFNIFNLPSGYFCYKRFCFSAPFTAVNTTEDELDIISKPVPVQSISTVIQSQNQCRYSEYLLPIFTKTHWSEDRGQWIWGWPWWKLKIKKSDWLLGFIKPFMIYFRGPVK